MELKTVLYKCNCCGIIKDSVFFQKPHKTCRQCRNSRMANRRKQDSTKEDLYKLLSYMERALDKD